MDVGSGRALTRCCSKKTACGTFNAQGSALAHARRLESHRCRGIAASRRSLLGGTRAGSSAASRGLSSLREAGVLEVAVRWLRTPSRGRSTAVLAVCVAILAFIAVSAFGGGGSQDTHQTASGQNRFGAYYARSPHVLSSTSIYSLSDPPPLPTSPAVFPSRFDTPIAQYRAYSIAQLGLMEQPLAALQSALAADDRPAAEAAWRAAYARLSAARGGVPGRAGGGAQPGDRRHRGRAGGRRLEPALHGPAQDRIRTVDRGAARARCSPPSRQLDARAQAAQRVAWRDDHAAGIRHPRPRDPRGRPARPAQRSGRSLERRRPARGPTRDWKRPKR